MSIETITYGILIPPLIAMVLNALRYRWGRDSTSGWIASLAVAVSAVFAWVLFFVHSSPRSWDLYTWIETSYWTAHIGFLIDSLTVTMLLVVTTVSACVHFYSLEYMEEDEGIQRFFLYLNLFVFSMLILVVANNILMMFIGWEGVGLCSYLLISFWYERESARKAGRKAFIVNRLGDFCFLIGIFLIIQNFWAVDFLAIKSQVESSLHTIPPHMLASIGLLLFGGAVGKSAQFPLYVWLPDAMEGPTPVSSLIHAATMVTAGVYLIARLYFLYSLPALEGVGLVIAGIGTITALYAATVALVHHDMKRILAFST
ncbi:MAG: proton-conducting transporter membrane subunit, partial [bacterium]